MYIYIYIYIYLLKTKWLFFKTSFKGSRIEDFLNLEWIN